MADLAPVRRPLCTARTQRPGTALPQKAPAAIAARAVAPGSVSPAAGPETASRFPERASVQMTEQVDTAAHDDDRGNGP